MTSTARSPPAPPSCRPPQARRNARISGSIPNVGLRNAKHPLGFFGVPSGITGVETFFSRSITGYRFRRGALAADLDLDLRVAPGRRLRGPARQPRALDRSRDLGRGHAGLDREGDAAAA